MKQTAVARPLNDADVQAFLKRQQVLQQKVPTQIIAGTQLQQVRAASVRVENPVFVNPSHLETCADKSREIFEQKKNCAEKLTRKF